MIEFDKEAIPQKTNGEHLSEVCNDEKALILSELLHKYFLADKRMLSFRMYFLNWLNSPVEVKEDE